MEISSRLKNFGGVFLISLSVLMLELSLTRLFSATMYYHFAFMAISLALFGSGASGVLIYIAQDRLKNEKTGQWLSIFSSLYAVSVFLDLIVILTNPLAAGAAGENYLRLGKIYLATAVPFFLAGCTISLAVSRFAKEINRLYLFDLAGAATGCLLLIPLLNALGAINILIIVGIAAAAAGLVFGSPQKSFAFGVAALLIAGLGAVLFYNSETKAIDIHSSKGSEESNLLFSKWNSFSRITVQKDADENLQIKIDADAATTIVRNGPNTAEHQDRRSDISALAYQIKSAPKTLIIGPGGGLDVATALVFGAPRITAVEINPIIAQDVMLNEPFRSYSGNIYSDPKVDLEVDEGRSFIRRSSEQYDVIQGTMVDTWAATGAGAFALSENNLYTVEAFKDYANHLSPDGVLTMTRWYLDPPDQLLRLVSISRAMMNELGIKDPERHFVIIRGSGDLEYRSPASFIFKRSALTDDEVRRLEDVARQNDFQILYTPLTQPDNTFTRLITADDPAAFANAFPTNIAATYDNNPFFFNSIRIGDLANIFQKSSEWKKTNLGSLILFILLIFTVVMVGLFIGVPLLLVRRRIAGDNASGTLNYLFYFGCLGAGFIIVEVAMIQKFILFLGHPVYALAVVLFSLLLFCGAGSYLSRRFTDDNLRTTLLKVVAVIAAVTVAYIFILPPIFYGLVWLPHTARIIISVLLIAPLALVMGMPMPIGIRLLARHAPSIIPWGWGVNGATSVLGSVGTLIIAIFSGFNQALIVGAAAYLAASFFISRGVKSDR